MTNSINWRGIPNRRGFLTIWKGTVAGERHHYQTQLKAGVVHLFKITPPAPGTIGRDEQQHLGGFESMDAAKAAADADGGTAR